MVNSKLRNYLFFFIMAGLGWTAAGCRQGEHSQAVAPSPDQPSQQQAQQQLDQQSALNDIAQADKLYAQRDDLANVRHGITLLRQARTADFGNYEANWKLAEFNYYLSDNTDNTEERNQALRDGIEAGKEATKLQPEKPEGHFWLGANYGGSAKASTLAGLSSVEDIRQEMETVLRLDEGYQGGSAYMALGQLYLDAPKMLGGDPLKAVQVLEKGQRFGENNSFYRLQLARAYLTVKHKDEARKQLDAIVNMKPDPGYLPEHRKALAEAHKLLDKGL